VKGWRINDRIQGRRKDEEIPKSIVNTDNDLKKGRALPTIAWYGDRGRGRDRDRDRGRGRG
jgi:hypothetical protein